MLVLTRKDGESVCLGHGIKVTVLSSCKGRIRLGIEAPADVTISRPATAKVEVAPDDRALLDELFAGHPR
jgi:carbon storage regulator CsrA